MQKWVRLPRPRQDLETQTTHGRHSWLAAKTLSLVEHSGAYALQVWWRPCPVRRGLAAAVKCHVRKARFFSVGSEQK